MMYKHDVIIIKNMNNGVSPIAEGYRSYWLK